MCRRCMVKLVGRLLALRSSGTMPRVRLMTHYTMQPRLQCSSDWEPVLSSYRPLRIHYAAGEMICQAGSYLAGVHLILRGAVSDMLLHVQGGRGYPDILGPGDLVGLEIVLPDSNGLSVSIRRALTAVDLLFVEESQWESALSDHPAFLREVLAYTTAKYMSIREGTREHVEGEYVLCRLLLVLGEACGTRTESGNISLPPDISLRILGDLLGVSGRRLRQAREAIPDLETSNGSIAFCAEAVRRILSRVQPISG